MRLLKRHYRAAHAIAEISIDFSRRNPGAIEQHLARTTADPRAPRTRSGNADGSLIARRVDRRALPTLLAVAAER
jgi:hypothetical protein